MWGVVVSYLGSWFPGVLESYLLLAGVVVASVQGDLESYIDGEEGKATNESIHQDAPDEESPGGRDESHRGVIYARVSSYRQANEGTSLSEQVRNLRAVADRLGIEVVREPIRDEGETGSDFDREGIRKVREVALEDEISHVLVDDVDRVGRHAVETLYYLYELREEAEVTVVTTTSGELDIDTATGMMELMHRALSAQMTNETRTRRAHEARMEQFKRKEWSAFYNSAPRGYRETEDGWLVVDPGEAVQVRRMFEVFRDAGETRAYTEVKERVSGVGSSRRSDVLRRELQRRLYVGEAAAGTYRSDEPSVVVSCPELQIVSEEVFAAAQEKIERIRERYSQQPAETDDISDLVEEFGVPVVLEESPVAKVCCPECGEPMVKNGQRKLTERTAHNYLCQECGRQRKFPTKSELEGMKSGTSEEG